MPYAAVFEMTPDKTAATSGGASRYASGSHPWNGHTGALTTNATRKPRNIHVLSFSGPVMAKVPRARPSAMTETSMRSEPAIV
jgi:hypothetical protein